MFAPVDFIIMENISKMKNINNHKVTFDLKGSIHGRSTKNFTPYILSHKLNFGTILKDVDFLKIK